MSNRKINLLFINPSTMSSKEAILFLDKSSILRLPDFEIPIGLLSIAAYIRENIKDVDIRLLDVATDLYKVYLNYKNMLPMSLDDFILQELNSVNFKPDIVGVSILYSVSYFSAIQIIEKVKEKWPGAIVICGGNHATNFHHYLLSNSNVDYVVRGEGELSFLDFMEQFQAGQKNIEVKGIIDRDKLKTNPDELSLLVLDLDKLPNPAYDLLDLDIYRKTVGLSTMFSRGCPFQCTFCASHTVHGKMVRFNSNDYILRQVKHIVEDFNIDKINVQDDLFAARKNEFLTLAKILHNNYSSVKFIFSNGFSVAVLDETIIDALIQMGTDYFIVAIESGSPYTQKYIIKKNVSLTKAKHILQYLWNNEITVCINIILGFPGETRALMQESIDFINSVDVDWTYIFTALPFPGTQMYQQFVSRGDIDPKNFDWDSMRHRRRAFDTPEISAQELEDLVYDTNIDCNYFNNTNLKHGQFKKAVNLFTTLMLERYPFHIVSYYCRALAYLGMHKDEEAIADFKECVKWISMNPESKRLFARYGNRMPLLKEYLNNKIKIGS